MESRLRSDEAIVRPSRGQRVFKVSRFAVFLAALAAFLTAAGTAPASAIVTRDAFNVGLKVDGKGHAVVYYTRAGKRYHPVFWGAVNARRPSRTIPQYAFKIDYSGGYMRLGYPLWKTIRNRCRRYDGPSLPNAVATCKAPDGSYWALQTWQRMLPNLGYTPWKAAQRVRELHVSHWTGALPKLELYTDWAYGDRKYHLFGRLTYRGYPVHGYTATSSGNPTDSYGRNAYLDTYNAVYGSGWKRENSFLAHNPGGNFCYLFFNRPSYYDSTTRPAGNGSRYRGTVIGPGVTPVVRTHVIGRPAYDAGNPDHVALEAAMNALGDQLAAQDDQCQQH